MTDWDIEQHLKHAMRLMTEVEKNLTKFQIEPWTPDEPLKLFEPRRPINFELLKATKFSMERAYSRIMDLIYEHDNGFILRDIEE